MVAQATLWLPPGDRPDREVGTGQRRRVPLPLSDHPFMVALAAGLHDDLRGGQTGMGLQAHRSEAVISEYVEHVLWKFTQTIAIRTHVFDQSLQFLGVEGDLPAPRLREHESTEVQGIQLFPRVAGEHAPRATVFQQTSAGPVRLVCSVVEPVAEAIGRDEVLQALWARSVDCASGYPAKRLSVGLLVRRPGAHILLEHCVEGAHAQRVLRPVEEVVVVVEPVHPHAVELPHVQRSASEEVLLAAQHRHVTVQAVQSSVLRLHLAVDPVVEPAELGISAEHFFVRAVVSMEVLLQVGVPEVVRVRHARELELEDVEVDHVADWIVGEELSKSFPSDEAEDDKARCRVGVVESRCVDHSTRKNWVDKTPAGSSRVPRQCPRWIPIVVAHLGVWPSRAMETETDHIQEFLRVGDHRPRFDAEGVSNHVVDVVLGHPVTEDGHLGFTCW